MTCYTLTAIPIALSAHNVKNQRINYVLTAHCQMCTKALIPCSHLVHSTADQQPMHTFAHADQPNALDHKGFLPCSHTHTPVRKESTSVAT